jgi:hypothetical protein
MSGKCIPPPPSGGSPSGVSTRNLDPMPRRGEVASIGGKRDFRAPSSHRSSPMGGSASRPRARSVGSLPSPTAGTVQMMRQSSSGAASPSRWCDVPRPQCVGKVGIRSCPKILPKGARATILRPCSRSSSHCLRVLHRWCGRANRTSQLRSPRGTRAKVCQSRLLPIHPELDSTFASLHPRSQNTATHSRSRRPPRFVVVR